MKTLQIISILSLSILSVTAMPQQKKAAKKKPSVNQTKGREQQQGGPGVFGTTYSIRGYFNNFNISLDKAWYDVAVPAGYALLPQRTKSFFTRIGASRTLLPVHRACREMGFQ